MCKTYFKCMSLSSGSIHISGGIWTDGEVTEKKKYRLRSNHDSSAWHHSFSRGPDQCVTCSHRPHPMTNHSLRHLSCEWTAAAPPPPPPGQSGPSVTERSLCLLKEGEDRSHPPTTLTKQRMHLWFCSSCKVMMVKCQT